MQRRQILGGAYPLTAYDFDSLRSIVIKNDITMNYINSWFDTMLDILSEAVHYPVGGMYLGSMIYDIAEKSKIKRGLFRYSYKKSIIRFAIHKETHEIELDLYLFDDLLPVFLQAAKKPSSISFFIEKPALIIYGIPLLEIRIRTRILSCQI